jgi:hypothetical protein
MFKISATLLDAIAAEKQETDGQADDATNSVEHFFKNHYVIGKTKKIQNIIDFSTCHLPHMGYEGSIGLVLRKMKNEMKKDIHVLGLFLAKNHDLIDKKNPSVSTLA